MKCPECGKEAEEWEGIACHSCAKKYAWTFESEYDCASMLVVMAKLVEEVRRLDFIRQNKPATADDLAAYWKAEARMDKMLKLINEEIANEVPTPL